jgi:DNA repair protein RecN (Recombination protein N)
VINQLRVRDLGVIADVELMLDEGMTAITGETGAGKTLIVEALELLVGGRSDPTLVRSGAELTVVEGQFFDHGEELVIQRTVPVDGRSRSTLNNELVALSRLAEIGENLVDLYGQHAHQSLLRPVEQRRALDQFGGINLEPLRALRQQINEIDAKLATLSGDDRLRERELDLLRYELREIESLEIVSSEEDEILEHEHDLLQSSVALREAVSKAHEHVVGEGGPGASDLVGEALQALSQHEPLAHFTKRFDALAAELQDLAGELRNSTDDFEENPLRLEEIRERRTAFARLIKKHGQSLGDVIVQGVELARQIEVLESGDEQRQELTDRRGLIMEQLKAEEESVGDQRRKSALPLTTEVEGHLHQLGLDGARLRIELPEHGLGEDVVMVFAANRGESMLPLAKVASGGELARAMLALRLVLSSGPSTLIFDEVDAGIGGEAAIAVGRALRHLGQNHQVIVVTHLAQVAAFADSQLVVDKYEENGRTLSRATLVEGDQRVVELARMLSGHQDLEVAKLHAQEMLNETLRDT